MDNTARTVAKPVATAQRERTASKKPTNVSSIPTPTVNRGAGLLYRARPALTLGANGHRPYLEPVEAVLAAPGAPLDRQTLAWAESHFAADFHGVRVHTDAKAAASAQLLNAHAYTSGQDLVFDQGLFAPDTPSGRQLLAHELTHVVQQMNYRGPRVGLLDGPGDAHETAAKHAASLAGAGQSTISSRTAATPAIQRQVRAGNHRPSDPSNIMQFISSANEHGLEDLEDQLDQLLTRSPATQATVPVEVFVQVRDGYVSLLVSSNEIRRFRDLTTQRLRDLRLTARSQESLNLSRVLTFATSNAGSQPRLLLPPSALPPTPLDRLAARARAVEQRRRALLADVDQALRLSTIVHREELLRIRRRLVDEWSLLYAFRDPAHPRGSEAEIERTIESQNSFLSGISARFAELDPYLQRVRPLVQAGEVGAQLSVAAAPIAASLAIGAIPNPIAAVIAAAAFAGVVRYIEEAERVHQGQQATVRWRTVIREATISAVVDIVTMRISRAAGFARCVNVLERAGVPETIAVHTTGLVVSLATNQVGIAASMRADGRSWEQIRQRIAAQANPENLALTLGTTATGMLMSARSHARRSGQVRQDDIPADTHAEVPPRLPGERTELVPPAPGTEVTPGVLETGRPALVPPPPRTEPPTGRPISAEESTQPRRNVPAADSPRAAGDADAQDRPTAPASPRAISEDQARPTQPDRLSDAPRDTVPEDTRPTIPEVEPNRAWLQWVNPGAETGAPERWENCVRAALAVDTTLGGRWAQAMPLAGGVPFGTVVRAFYRLFGARMVPTTVEGIRTELMNTGRGARGIVVATRPDGQPGHVFNAFYDAGVVRFVDGQAGNAATLTGYREFYWVRTDGNVPVSQRPTGNWMPARPRGWDRPTSPGTPGAIDQVRPTQPVRLSDAPRDTPVEDTRPTTPTSQRPASEQLPTAGATAGSHSQVRPPSQLPRQETQVGSTLLSVPPHPFGNPAVLRDAIARILKDRDWIMSRILEQRRAALRSIREKDATDALIAIESELWLARNRQEAIRAGQLDTRGTGEDLDRHLPELSEAQRDRLATTMGLGVESAAQTARTSIQARLDDLRRRRSGIEVTATPDISQSEVNRRWEAGRGPRSR